MTKRFFDIILSLFGIFLFGPIIAIGWIVSTCSTMSNGIFVQNRVGRNGKIFKILKLKTMVDSKSNQRSSIAANCALSITKSGAVLRKYKIDELPQLFNVLIGDMSFVGPRPDIPGYADKLVGEQRKILELRPGITGPASLAFKNEEDILLNASDPCFYNDNVIWPEKIRLNLEYYYNRTLIGDIKIMLKTVIGI